MRSQDLDPSRTAASPRRAGRRGRTVAAIAGAVALASGGAVWLVTGASSASASTITETFAGSGPTGALELQLSETINQPANVAPGGKITISVVGSSQDVPTSQSGVPVNYISGLKTLIPIPPNSTFVSGSIVGGDWSFTPSGGSAQTGALTITECTGPGTGCTATAPSSTFLGPGTSTPYLEATTGSTQFTAGGKLTLPTWSFQVTAGNSGSIQSTVSEFDTTASINLAGTNIPISLATYPAVTVSGCLATPAVCTSQPAYKFQAIATTTIGSSGATTTVPSSSTTATGTNGGGTSTTLATGSGSSGQTGSTATTTAGSTGALANTGIPNQVWFLGLLGLVLLDFGYLALSATWRGRRARNSSGT